MKIKSTSFFFIVLLSCVYSAHSQYRAQANVAVQAPGNSNLDGQAASVVINSTTIVSAASFTTSSQRTNGKSINASFPNEFKLITDIFLSPDSPNGPSAAVCATPDGTPITQITNTQDIPSTTIGSSYRTEITDLFLSCSTGQIADPTIPQFFEIWHLRDLSQPQGEEATAGIDDLIVLDPQNAKPSTFKVLYQIGSGPFEQLLGACQGGPIRDPNACPGETQTQFPFPQSGATIDVDLIPNLPQLPVVVRFQLDYGDGVFSNIVNYTIGESSPAYTSVVEQNPVCAYNLGDFTINFTEAINENLRFNLFSYPEDEFLNGSTALVDGSSISWSTITGSSEAVLNPGTYRLTYQKLPSAELVPGIGEPPIIITITPSTALEYGIGYTDISCFNENNGEITITINPNNNGSIGTPPYNYVLGNGNTGTFSGASTTISGLSAGSTTIQVFDSNACTERL